MNDPVWLVLAGVLATFEIFGHFIFPITHKNYCSRCLNISPELS